MGMGCCKSTAHSGSQQAAQSASKTNSKHPDLCVCVWQHINVCVFVNVQAEVAAAAATVAALSGERDSHRAAAEEAVQRANVSVRWWGTNTSVCCGAEGQPDMRVCACLQQLFVGCPFVCVCVHAALPRKSLSCVFPARSRAPEKQLLPCLCLCRLHPNNTAYLPCFASPPRPPEPSTVPGGRKRVA